MIPVWLTIVGLAFDFVGAGLLAWDLVSPTDRQLLESMTHRLGSNEVDENISHPAFPGLLRSRRRARTGVGLLALGFLLQLIAAIMLAF